MAIATYDKTRKKAGYNRGIYASVAWGYKFGERILRNQYLSNQQEWCQFHPQRCGENRSLISRAAGQKWKTNIKATNFINLINRGSVRNAKPERCR